MRVPSDVSNTVNAYLAFKAVLQAILAFNPNSSVGSTADDQCTENKVFLHFFRLTRRVATRSPERSTKTLYFQHLDCPRYDSTEEFGFNLTAEIPITSLLCPGLATGEGKMPAETCAIQMHRAYEVCILNQFETNGGLAGAVNDHLNLVKESP